METQGHERNHDPLTGNAAHNTIAAAGQVVKKTGLFWPIILILGRRYITGDYLLASSIIS